MLNKEICSTCYKQWLVGFDARWIELSLDSFCWMWDTQCACRCEYSEEKYIHIWEAQPPERCPYRLELLMKASQNAE